jgi:hypothetical protein
LDVIHDYRLDATCVEYDALVQQPEETVADLSRFIGRPLQPTLVERDLRTHVQPISPSATRLYKRVQQLGGVRPQRRSTSLPPATYLERADEIERRATAAKAQWEEQVGLPELAPLRGEASETLANAIRVANEASAAYVDILASARAEVDALWPPAGFERYQELVKDFVDKERLVATFVKSLTEGVEVDQERLANTIEGWRKLCSPDVAVAAARERTREREHAVREGGGAA